MTTTMTTTSATITNDYERRGNVGHGCPRVKQQMEMVVE